MTYITAIQKYSIHDGEGIRTTVFWKGCPLHCEWCHNPETQSAEPELMDHPEKCSGCGKCTEICPEHAIRLDKQTHAALTDRKKCTGCGKCLEVCPENIREIAGKSYTLEHLMKELMKDQMFYEESGGGVTFSGGEVMTADMEEVLRAAKEIKKQEISLNIDTCGAAPWENFEMIMPYTDTFLYDLKVLDPKKHKQYTGAENDLILSNLEKLSASDAKISLRIPVVPGVNDTEEDMLEIIRFLQQRQIRTKKIHLLPYHGTGAAKYERLGQKYKGEKLHVPTQEQMDQLAELFRNAGFYEIKIGG
jgi:pyruvate formate lyase activating enzyme